MTSEETKIREDVPFDLCDRAFKFSLRIIKLCQTLDKKPGVGWTLSRQILRSGTSIGANVEEGQSGQSRADFVGKYSISLKEARETLYWLRLLGESGLVERARIRLLLDESEELIKILTSIIKKAKTP